MRITSSLKTMTFLTFGHSFKASSTIFGFNGFTTSFRFIMVITILESASKILSLNEAENQQNN